MEDRKQIPTIEDEYKYKRIRRTERYKDLYPENNETQSQPQKQDKPKIQRPVYTAASNNAVVYTSHNMMNTVPKKRKLSKRILALLAASGLAVGGIILFGGKSEGDVEGKTPTPTSEVTIPTPTPTPKQFRMDLAVTPITMASATPTPQKSEIEIAKDRFIAMMQSVEQAYGKESLEYKFFSEYSTTVNQNLPRKNGEITSAEEWFEVAESDPERFKIEGLKFLREMCLDYNKLLLYNKHKHWNECLDKNFRIKTPEDIVIKYEQLDESNHLIGTYVKSADGKTVLENVGIEYTRDSVSGIPNTVVSRTYYGKAYGRSDTQLDSEDWSHIISINEFYETVFRKNGVIISPKYSSKQCIDFGLYHMNFYIQEFENMIEHEIPTERDDR